MTAAVTEGVAAVTGAALLFGVVAALVKYAGVHPLILLQFRSAVQLALSLAAVRCSSSSSSSSEVGWHLLGPRPLWGVLALRSLLYWGFLCMWWLALTYVPVGDATCVVYLGPIFTAVFAWLLLREQPPAVFPFCVVLSLAGVVLVTQAGGGEDSAAAAAAAAASAGSAAADRSRSYSIGTACAFCSAVAGGLLPALTRQSKEAHWATVELWAAATSCLVLTPCSLLVWLHGDSYPASLRAAELQATVAAVLQLQLHGVFGIMLLVSLVGFTGLGLQTYGYQREEVRRCC